MLRHFEDFAIGQIFHGGPVTVTPAAIKAFAAEFDPQDFHLDEAAAEQSFFGTLVASGFHTMALTMRLMVTSDMQIAGGVIGGGIDEVRWPVATRSGDRLTAEMQVVDLSPPPAGARLPRGRVILAVETRREDGTVVMRCRPRLTVPLRASAGQDGQR